jgi:hypothetical protein
MTKFILKEYLNINVGELLKIILAFFKKSKDISTMKTKTTSTKTKITSITGKKLFWYCRECQSMKSNESLKSPVPDMPGKHFIEICREQHRKHWHRVYLLP